MGSITQSPDRVGQALSGSAVQQGAGDSALQPADSNPVQVVEQAFTGVSAAEIVYESRQQHSSVSEGVASAGHPPQLSLDRMDEFVPAGAAPAEPPPSAAAGCEGETSGGDYVPAPAGGSNGYGELIAGGGTAAAATAAAAAGALRGGTQPPPSPMDFQTSPFYAMAPAGPGPSPGGKRKSSFEASDILEPKRPEGLPRVPSDLAMVTGLSDGEAGGDLADAPPFRRPLDPTDSNLAGIRAGVAAAPTLDGGDTAQAMDAAARPTDDAIIAWENQIRDEEVLRAPLVGDTEPLEALEAEYLAGSDIFLAKIATIRRGYSAIRRTRGDGNCFFRAFIFGYLEGILRRSDLAERDAAVGRLSTLRQRLLDAGYDELVMESPMEVLLGMLRAIGAPGDALTLDALEGNMRSEDVSNYVVFLLRLITSAEVKRRAEFFAPFIMGLSEMDVDTFCRVCIDVMGEESDHVQMVALTDALNVPVRVVYLDRSGAPGGGGDGDGAGFSGGAMDAAPGVSFASAAPGGAASTAGTVVSAAAGPPGVKVDVHDFLPEGTPPGTEPRVHLLYRPGHYDILYPAPAAL